MVDYLIGSKTQDSDTEGFLLRLIPHQFSNDHIWELKYW